MYSVLLNTYSKLWNMCYKLCNKLFLADSENYHGLRKNFLADSKKRKAESKYALPWNIRKVD